MRAVGIKFVYIIAQHVIIGRFENSRWRPKCQKIMKIHVLLYNVPLKMNENAIFLTTLAGIIMSDINYCFLV